MSKIFKPDFASKTLSNGITTYVAPFLTPAHTSEMELNVDFKEQHQWLLGWLVSQTGRWANCTEEEYNTPMIDEGDKRRIIAVPIPPAEKEEIQTIVCTACGNPYSRHNSFPTTICGSCKLDNYIADGNSMTPAEKDKDSEVDCSRHKKELFGEIDMKKVAIAIGDLHYDTLWGLLNHLYGKLIHDSKSDELRGRKKLADELSSAAGEIYNAAQYIGKAYEISKPFMK